MITYEKALKQYAVLLNQVATAVGEHIGEKEISLDDSMAYDIATTEGQVTYIIRSFTKDKVVVRDMDTCDENELTWQEMDIIIAIHILRNIENGKVHEYDPEED
jgi:hypothetical protein